jgi:hypothetical protein
MIMKTIKLIDQLKASSELHAAARLIYEASTGKLAPDFFASNENALKDIKERAYSAKVASS